MMTDEATVSAEWAERRINEVTRERDELRDRLGTILRSARAAGIELGEVPDLAICKLFGAVAGATALLDGVPITRDPPLNVRVGYLVELHKKYRVANTAFAEERDVALRDHAWCDDQLLGQDDDGQLKLLCCAHLNEGRCFVCEQTEEECKRRVRDGDPVGRCDYARERLTREQQLVDALSFYALLGHWQGMKEGYEESACERDLGDRARKTLAVCCPKSEEGAE
jgi:hypothetical protein